MTRYKILNIDVGVALWPAVQVVVGGGFGQPTAHSALSFISAIWVQIIDCGCDGIMSMGMETPCPALYNIYILSIHRIYNIYILSIDRVNMPGKLRQVSPEHVWLCRVTYRVNRAFYFLQQPHPRGWFESEWTRLTNLCPDSIFNILLCVPSSRIKRECLTISNHLPSTNQQQWHWQSKLVFSLVYTGKLT